jgi:hypothetical protein
MSTNCLVKDISSQVDAALADVNKQYQKTASELDRKMLEAAKARSLLDFPLANQLLQNATNFLSSAVNGALDSTSNLINTTIGTAAMAVGSVVAVIGTIAATLDNQLKNVIYGSLVEGLKTEIRVRLLYYRLLNFHMSSLISVLQSLQNQQPSNLYRLRIAYGYIVQAQTQLHKFVQVTNPLSRGTSKPPLPLRPQKALLTSAFNNIAAAEGIIKGDMTVGKKLLQSKTQKDFIKILNEQVDQRILAQSIYMFETIAWNLARLAAMIPVPFSGLVYTAGSITLPGVAAKRFSATEQDRLLADLQTKSGALSISALDRAKGLLPTNILADQLMTQLLNFETDWVDLKNVSDTLVTLASPAMPLIDSLKNEMQGALENRDAEITLIGKEAKWIMQMDLLAKFRQLFFQSLVSTSALASNAYAADVIWKEIDKYQKKPLDDQIFNSIFQVILLLPQAPFSNRALLESRVLCKGVQQLVNKSVIANTSLLNKLMAYDTTSSSAASAAFGQLLGAMTNLPAPASTIAQGLMTGQLGAVAKGLNSLVNVGGDLASNINKLGASCDEDKPGPSDALVEEVNVVEFERYEDAGNQSA